MCSFRSFLGKTYIERPRVGELFSIEAEGAQKIVLNSNRVRGRVAWDVVWVLCEECGKISWFQDYSGLDFFCSCISKLLTCADIKRRGRAAWVGGISPNQNFRTWSFFV